MLFLPSDVPFAFTNVPFAFADVLRDPVCAPSCLEEGLLNLDAAPVGLDDAFPDLGVALLVPPVRRSDVPVLIVPAF